MIGSQAWVNFKVEIVKYWFILVVNINENERISVELCYVNWLEFIF